jgi:hypothetical protein
VLRFGHKSTKNRAVQDGAVASFGRVWAMPEPIPKKHIRQIADGIRQFGFTNPVLIGEGGGSLPDVGGCPGWRQRVRT